MRAGKTIGVEYNFQQMMLGKLDNHMQKNETGLLPYSTHANADQTSTCKYELNYKTSVRERLSWL
jgi:hypothetical protein